MAQSLDLLLQLLESMAIFVMALLLYQMIKDRVIQPALREGLLGISFGLLAWFSMTHHIPAVSGVDIDGRHVMIVIAAFFGGGLTTLVTTALVVGFQVAGVQDGAVFLPIAIGITLQIAALALLAARWLPRGERKHPWVVALSAGGIQFMALFAWFLAPDPNIGRMIFAHSALPLTLACMVGSGILAYLLQQTNRRYQTEDRLRASRERHKGIVENTVDGIIVITEFGIVEEYNAAAEKIFGYTAAEVIGQNIKMLMPEPDRGRHDSYLANFVRTGQAKVIGSGREVTARHKSGRAFTMDLAVNEAFFDGKRYFTGVVRDITERKRAETELARQKSLFQGIVNHMGESLMMTDSERRIVLCNPAATLLFGYTLDEMAGHPTSMLYKSLEEFERQGRERYNLSAEDKLLPYVVQYRTKGGRVFSGETLGSAIRDENGEVLGFLGIIRDISERLQAEAELRYSEARLVEAQKLAHLGNWEWDVPTGNLFWSEEIYHIFGRDPVTFEPSYAAFQEQIHPEDRAAVLASEERTKTGAPHDVEHRIVLPDGSERYIHERGQMQFDAAGQPLRLIGTVQDITERKKAELALQRHNAGLEALNEVTALRNVSIAEQVTLALDLGCRHMDLEIGIVSRIEGDDYTVLHFVAPEGVPLQNGQHFSLGQTYCDITLAKNDVVTINHMGGSVHAAHPCYQAFHLEAYIGVSYFIGERLAGTINFSSPHPYGRAFDEGDRAFLRMMGRWVGTLFERQKTQENLALSESRLSISQSFANIGTWDWNIADGSLYWSERIAPLFGYPAGDLETSYENFLAAVHPEDRQMLQEAVKACVETGAEYDIEHRVIWPDGTVRWLQEKGDVVRAEDGTPLRMLGVVQDIHQVKTAEAELLRNTEELEDLYENAPSAYVTVNLRTGTIQRHNQALIELLGYSGEELVGRRVLDLYTESEEGRQRAVQAMDLVRRGHEIHSAELEMRRKDGARIWVSLSVRPRTDATGRVTEGRAIVVDITRRKRVEKELELSRQRLQNAVEALNVGFSLYDFDGRLRVCNQNYRDMYKKSAPIMEEGRSFEDILRYGIAHGQYPEAAGREEDFVTERLQRYAHPGAPFEQQLHDGRWILVNEQLTPEGDRVGVRTDITQMKRTQLELQQARESAEAANNAKSEFLSSMSHELRTPLNAILGFSQLLESSNRDALNEKQKRQVVHIRKSGEHLLQLINEVLDLAKIEAGNLSITMEPISLSRVVRESLALVQTLADDRDISLQLEDDRSGSRTVMADYTRLRQVLLNLLSNAIKYNNEGGSVVINIGDPQEGFIRLSVTDTGQGIAPEYQDKVFEPFNRLGADVGSVEGTGIGLALTRKMIEHMGGRIGFESPPGAGCTFWIEMAVGLNLLVVGRSRGNTATQNVFQFSTSPRRVLYVEDDQANQSLMEEIFDNLPGLELLVAPDAESGLGLALATRPDVILMDINLPGKGGIDATTQLKADPATRDIPVIALSADATRATQQAAKKAGFLAYLTKPVELDQLLTTLNNALGEET
ncbi:hypothetical protein JCM17960_03760 [Magnetospira thiophila]